MGKIIIFVIILLVMIGSVCLSKEYDYKFYFSNDYLREKFGLDEEGGEEEFNKIQRKYERAREKDVEILKSKMVEEVGT